MGFNDRMSDELDPSEYQNLPPEAHDQLHQLFNPDNNWIRGADKDDQITAMRSWFLLRYTDPANSTPYNGREGGYQFIHGGPYDPCHVIQERFDRYVDFEVMEEVFEELQGIHGDQWAPADHTIEAEEDFYDWYLSTEINRRVDPMDALMTRLDSLKLILEDVTANGAVDSAAQITYGAAITALEAYLWDTIVYWSDTQEKVQHRLIATIPEFQKEKISISEIHEVLPKLPERLSKYLQDFIWHRLEKVKPMFEQGLEISFPEIGDLMGAVLVRHDIVHRAGRNKDGAPVAVTANDVGKLIVSITAFVRSIEAELTRVYPVPADEALF